MHAGPFAPPRWLKSPHLQTMAAAAPIFLRRPSDVVNEEELRVAIEGGALHGRAWWHPDPGPAVVITHGIGGSKESHCCVRAGLAFHRAGFHVVRLDMRGAGESVVDAPSLYHAGLTSDLDLAVRQLSRDARVTSVALLGFSGGGSQALKLAGEWGPDVPEKVSGVATISAPLDYTRVAVRMDSLRCLPYRFHVLRGLVARARAFVRHHPTRARYREPDLARIKRFRDFDGSLIVPMHGFSDVDAYYREASAGPWLPKITVPTLLLHSEDDPMVPIGTVRPWLAGASSHVQPLLSRQGGHIGWLGGLDESGWIASWANRQVLAFLAALTPPRSCSPDSPGDRFPAPRHRPHAATDRS